MRNAGWLTLFFTVIIAGCGGVEWFPEKEKTPTTPTAFFFINKTDVTSGETVSSDPVTISGIQSGSAPISVTGDTGSNSEFSINGGAFTSTAGTVNNNDRVALQHTASSQAGGTARTTLTVGDFSADFTSTAAIIGKLIFTPKTVATSQPAYSDPVRFSGKEGLTFQISVQNGAFAIAGSGYSGDCASLQNNGQALINYTDSLWSISNGQIVCVRNFSPATTTVIVNDVTSTFTSSSP